MALEWRFWWFACIRSGQEPQTSFPTPGVTKKAQNVDADVIPDAGIIKNGRKCQCGRCLSVDVVLSVEGAVHLSKNLKVGLAVKYGGAIYGVVYQEVLDSVHDDDLIVIGK